MRALVLCGAIENLFNFQINIGTMAFIVNGILLLFAGFIIGWNFGIKTILCIIVLPASLNFFPGNTARRAGVARGTGRYPTRCDQPVR